MDCPNCGKQNSNDAPLCSSCGWVIYWKPAAHSPGRQTKKDLVIAVLIAAAILLPILILYPTAKRGSKTEYLEISEQSMASYQAICQVDRKVMGFPPLPSEGTVKVEIIDRQIWNYEYNPPNYDVMLHFYEIYDGGYKYTARTVGLKKTNGVLQWVHEQMMFHGPKEYIDDEGFPAKEWIVLRCETEQIGLLGQTMSGTIVMYTGPDKRLAREEGWTIDAGDLSLADVVPILREWGYIYEVADLERSQPPQVSHGIKNE